MKANYVERVIKTIKGKIYKYFIYKQSFFFICLFYFHTKGTKNVTFLTETQCSYTFYFLTTTQN